jgi:uroporphyrin-III C-methyltransferase / precorrin-2 dehydrogenase / sirohydrochlorin ferrochelatase
MHSLPIFVRLAGRPVILVGIGDVADAKRRLLERAGAVIVDESFEAALAIVAVEDEAEATKAVIRLKARGILVNAVDRVALCDFTLPAIVDRDPVLIAVGSGGASAGLAKALRQRLEKLLPPSLGRLAEDLFAARPTLRAKFPNPTARRQAIDAALSEGGALDPFSNGGDVAAWLSSGQTDAPDRVEKLALTSADPDELTLRAARLLSTAATIYHSADVPLAILNRARADATRVLGEAPEQAEAGLTLIIKMA